MRALGIGACGCGSGSGRQGRRGTVGQQELGEPAPGYLVQVHSCGRSKARRDPSKLAK